MKNNRSTDSLKKKGIFFAYRFRSRDLDIGTEIASEKITSLTDKFFSVSSFIESAMLIFVFIIK
jgi:hypothetical protein